MNTSKTVLIVDDDLILAHALRDKLNRDEIDVIQAGDGEEGLQVAFEKHPDLILLDVVMPKVDGISVLKRLRGDDWGKNVPIILLTNLDKSCNEVSYLGYKNCSCIIKANSKLAEVVAEIERRLQ